MKGKESIFDNYMIRIKKKEKVLLKSEIERIR